MAVELKLRIRFGIVVKFLRRLLLQVLAVGPIPKHIAIIMDGNRRFADKRRIDRTRGHIFGYDRLIATLESCMEMGVKFVTVYAFSIDNFKRSPDEVSALMALMEEKLNYLAGSEGVINNLGVRVEILGDLALVPESVKRAAERAMFVTRQNNSLVLNLCLAYRSTTEIVNAFQEVRDCFLIAANEKTTDSVCQLDCNAGNVGEDYSNLPIIGDGRDQVPKSHLDSDAISSHEEILGKEKADGARFPATMEVDRSCPSSSHNFDSCPSATPGKITSQSSSISEVERLYARKGKKRLCTLLNSITAAELERHLYTRGSPPPDLLIRTSGETRLSNFLLWQCSHAYLAFCTVLWPDFGLRHLVWVILAYQRSFPSLQRQRQLHDQLVAKESLLSRR